MENYLEHHGVLGMKWGVRRYQNKDGTRTAAGRKHYGMSEKRRAKVEAKANREVNGTSWNPVTLARASKKNDAIYKLYKDDRKKLIKEQGRRASRLDRVKSNYAYADKQMVIKGLNGKLTTRGEWLKENSKTSGKNYYLHPIKVSREVTAKNILNGRRFHERVAKTMSTDAAFSSKAKDVGKAYVDWYTKQKHVTLTGRVGNSWEVF